VTEIWSVVAWASGEEAKEKWGTGAERGIRRRQGWQVCSQIWQQMCSLLHVNHTSVKLEQETEEKRKGTDGWRCDFSQYPTAWGNVWQRLQLRSQSSPKSQWPWTHPGQPRATPSPDPGINSSSPHLIPGEQRHLLQLNLNPFLGLSLSSPSWVTLCLCLDSHLESSDMSPWHSEICHF